MTVFAEFAGSCNVGNLEDWNTAQEDQRPAAYACADIGTSCQRWFSAFVIGLSRSRDNKVSFSRRVPLHDDRDRLLRLDELFAWQWLKRHRRNPKGGELLSIEKLKAERFASCG